MEIMNCSICNNKINLDNFLKTYISDFNNQEYKLYHCYNCDIEFWWPMKIIPEFYEKEGNSAYELYHKGLRDLQPWHKFFFKHFDIKNIKGKLLDVGCGEGIFLKEVKKLGFDVYGIDFDKKSIKIAKEKYDLENVFAMSLEEFYSYAQNKNLKFDIITFFEVLEHQDKPKDFLMIIKKLLNDNGYISGTVPNRNSIFMEFYRGKIDKNDLPPHHFLWFSIQSLKRFLIDNDFIIEKIITKNIEDLIINLETLITGKKGYNLKLTLRKSSNSKRNLITILKFLRKLTFYPIAYCASFFLKGSHIYFQAKLK